MENVLSFNNIYNLIKNRFKSLLIIAILVAIISSIFSLDWFIKPRFLSTAIMYPVNLKPYSDESETEQLMQLLASTDIRDNIIAKFDLGKKYELDPTESYYKYNLNLAYNERFVVSKTSYESVKLEVEDEDPEMAKQMAEEVINQVNLKATALSKQKAYEQVVSIENQMKWQSTIVDSMENKLSKLRIENGLSDYNIQVKEYTKSYLKLLYNRGSNEATEKIKKTLDNLGEKGGTLRTLNDVIFIANYEYAKLFEEYQENYKLASQNITYTNVIVQPEASDKKSYPIRWLIVSISVVSALLFAILFFAIYDQRKFL
jgi:capsule polysaccharide export protein KpsE/RkpR